MLLIVIAFGAALLVKTFLVDAFSIPSGSMEQTLRIGDRMLVNKVIYHFRDPARGEVIVFRGTGSWHSETAVKAPTNPFQVVLRFVGSVFTGTVPGEKDLTKRVVAVGGDTVRCCDSAGRVTVNGKPLNEPYVYDNTPLDARPFGPVRVQPGRLFVLGDHRGVSADSRFHLSDEWQGTVPVDQVIGQAFVVVWPITHWSPLSIPDTFTDLALGPALVATGRRFRRQAPRKLR